MRHSMRHSKAKRSSILALPQQSRVLVRQAFGFPAAPLSPTTASKAALL